MRNTRKLPKGVSYTKDGMVRIEPTKLAEDLHDYIRDRAAVEGVKFDLSYGWFGAWLAHGVSTAFGVHVEGGRMVKDDQEPEPGYFDRWVSERA